MGKAEVVRFGLSVVVGCTAVVATVVVGIVVLKTSNGKNKILEYL